MRAPLNSSRAWLAAVCMVAVLTGCGKKEEASPQTFVIPEVNATNCKSAAIKAMPENEARQKFADLCFRFFEPIRSEPKSYTF